MTYQPFDIEDNGRHACMPSVDSKFTLTQDHLTLLQHAYVQWQDCETGAPEIDPKRPYGNSSVGADVAEILGRPLPDYDTQEDAYRKVCQEMLAIHRETHVALQIVLSNLPNAVTPGVYVCEAYGREWKRVQ